MDTSVRIEIPGGTPENCGEAVERAFDWFRRVEVVCTRFDESSEVMQLAKRPHEPTAVSRILLEVTRFALDVADASDGAFDPTVGHSLEQQGFNRNYRTGEIVQTQLAADRPVSHRDVLLDDSSGTITLLQPLILDLGAVAKGFAIDLAARALAPFGDYAINAGGDIFVAGSNWAGTAWRIGIRHPRNHGELLTTVSVSNQSVCTSGDYERAVEHGHHVFDPRSGRSAEEVCSVTVVAPTAMAADALGTAAFVLGLSEGCEFLQRNGVEGLLVSTSLEERATPGFRRYENA